MSDCEHGNVRADVLVARFEETGTRMAEITIKCLDCDQPFHFKGLPYGLNVYGAARSPNGTEARIAIDIGEDWPIPLSKELS